MLAANADVLEDKVVKRLNSHSEHETTILLKLARQLRQTKLDVVAELCGDYVLPRERIYEVISPAQCDHDPAQCVEDVLLFMQVME